MKRYKLLIIATILVISIVVTLIVRNRRKNGKIDIVNIVIDEIMIEKDVKDMKIDQAGLDFIKRWEGLRLYVYDDATGQRLVNWNERATIGYGHLIKTKSEFNIYKIGISEETAEDLLRKDLESAEITVRRNLEVPVTQEQYNALVSHAFNTGRASENLYKLVNKKKEKVSYSGRLWNLYQWWTGTYITNASTNEVMQGLVNRRNDEYNLFA